MFTFNTFHYFSNNINKMEINSFFLDLVPFLIPLLMIGVGTDLNIESLQYQLNNIEEELDNDKRAKMKSLVGDDSYGGPLSRGGLRYLYK